MNRIIIIILLGFNIIFSQEYHIIQPQPYSIVTRNTIRIKTDIPEKGINKIDSVLFFARYLNSNGIFTVDSSRKLPLRQVPFSPILIGSEREYPFECVWDCKNIPNLDIFSLFLSFEVYQNGRLFFHNHNVPVTSVIISRSYTAFLPHTLFSLYKTKNWEDKDFVEFGDATQKIRAGGSWNKDSLYLKIFLKDDFPIKNHPDGDYITVCLDPRNYANPLNFADNKTIDLWLDGHYNISYFLKNDVMSMLATQKGISYRVDSVNDVFILNLAVSWNILGINPKNNLRMGLNIINIDFDYTGASPYHYTWNQSEVNNMHDPCLWWKLELAPKPFRYYLWIPVVILLTGIIIIVVLKILFKKNTIPDAVMHPKLQKIKKKIDSEYFNPDMSKKEMAVMLGFSPNYFGKIFNRYYGMSFQDYLTEVRLIKSAELIRNSNLNLFEASRKAGFANYKTFVTQFKKKYGLSPSDYFKSPK